MTPVLIFQLEAMLVYIQKPKKIKKTMTSIIFPTNGMAFASFER
jgi:hypothetical protein